MSHGAIDVNAFEAKMRLAELLRETERGGSFVIRRRGKAVARLLPPAAEGHESDLTAVRAAFRRLRARVRGRVKIRGLIEAGRRR